MSRQKIYQLNSDLFYPGHHFLLYHMKFMLRIILRFTEIFIIHIKFVQIYVINCTL